MLFVFASRVFFIVIFSFSLANCAITFGSQASTLKFPSGGKLFLQANTALVVDGTILTEGANANSIQGLSVNDVLTFSDGCLQQGSASRSIITGTLDPSSSDTIKLTAGQTLVCDNHSVVQAVNVSGLGSTIKGQAYFSSAIVLADSSSSVNLALQNKLTQNITMNGGTVILQDDLSLQSGVVFSGAGTVDVNYKKLTLGSGSWAGTTTFLNASDIFLEGAVSLSGTWDFQGSGGTSVLNGDSNSLDISSGGVIRVNTNHTLYLVNLNVYGLGSGFGDFDILSGGSIKLFSTRISLSASFPHDSGSIVAQSGDCLVLVREPNRFNVSGASTTLVVDGVVLFYDPLDTSLSDASPFITSSGGVISYLNGGTIRSTVSAASAPVAVTTTTPTLESNQTLGQNSNLTVVNDTPATPKAVTMDGQGNFIQFNYSSGQYFTIQENVTLTITNAMVKDFDPALINFQGSGGSQAKLEFGDNTVVSLSKNLNFSTVPLNFVGDATINVGGNELTLGAANILNVTVPGKTLTIQNGNIYASNPNAIQLTSDTAKLELKNSDIVMDSGGLNFGQGNLDISGSVRLAGLDSTSTSGASVFTFASKGSLEVKSGGSLNLDRDVGFFYNPDTSADGGNPALQKRHFKLASPSATLRLDSCNFSTGSMGMALDYGRVLVDGKTSINISPLPGAEVEFGTALDVQIAPGATLDINGGLKYVASSYP